MKNKRDIYNMKLSEDFCFHKYAGVIRVPGGWVYWLNGAQQGVTSCFVPFSDEFKEKK